MCKKDNPGYETGIDVYPPTSGRKLKNLQTYKPDSVFQLPETAVIYLSRSLRCGINLPTHHHRTGRSQAMIYMAFQHLRFTQLLCCHNNL
jgi:hypothetical protein